MIAIKNIYNNICFKFNARKSNFAKVNTDALFKAVDVDNSGDISESEWVC